jgi:DNA-binding NarL/FixJ family response regulator
MTALSNIRLLIVDDHPIVRQGLKNLLETYPQLSVVAEAADGEQALVQAIGHKPDVILMDVNLPKLNGYEATKAILTAWPAARIIVLTNQDDAQVLRQFVEAGVKGFFLKDVPLETLVQTIQQVAQDAPLSLSPELANKLEASLAAPKRRDDLTERECQVLAALCKGYSNQQLADLLCVSPKTVHNHLYSIYSKIGVHSRAEAMVWAIEAGLK